MSDTVFNPATVDQSDESIKLAIQRKKRASRPKTKTGCGTCKTRRAKCDEGKPECVRCLKLDVKCDGYPILTPKARRAAHELKIQPWGGGRPLAPASSIPLYRLPPEKLVRDETEERYFQVFRRDVIPEISGIFDNSFWESVILSSCNEPFIRDALLAIAAINLSIKDSRRQPGTLAAGASDSKSSAKHYQFAVERYGRAVHTMRSTLTNEEHHLRKVLIGCLLVFCFESFQGYPKAALQHVICGYHLLQNWMIRKSYLLVLPNNTPRASNLIEDELLDAFNRLHANAVTVIGDSCTAEAHSLEQANSDQILENMPKVFSDFGESQRYLIYVMKRCAAFVQTAVGLDHSNSSSYGQQDREQTASMMEWSASIHTPFPSGKVPQSTLDACQRYLGELAKWQSAFNPLRISPDRAIQIGVVVMQAAVTSIRLVVQSVIARNECFWDQFLPEFRAILSLAKKFFRMLPKQASLGQEGRFNLDISIVPALYFICKYCRDGQIRRDAIALMNLCPRREGVWDSGFTSKVSIFLMQVEEEGLVNGYIPEFARARITTVLVDVLKKTAEVECMKRIPDTNGEVSIRRTRIDWD